MACNILIWFAFASHNSLDFNYNISKNLQDIEDKVIALSQKSPPDAQNVVSTRKEFLQDIFASPENMQHVNVLKLWKQVYYPSISFFRKLLQKPSMKENTIKKTKNRMKKHIHEVNAELMSLRDYILNAWNKENDNANASITSHIEKQLTQIYISLGDLARYNINYCSEKDNRVYTECRDYYLRALAISPSSGLIHNQLAILAHYDGNDIVAIYRYFRSLAVENPYLSATENLCLIFEKNRQIDEKQKKENVDELKKFLLEFIRVHGILFTKISVEQLVSVQARVMRDFDLVLKNHIISEGLMLILCIMNIFQIDHAGKKVAEDPSIYSSTILFRHATNITLKMMSRLMKETFKMGEAGLQTGYLASITIFLRYIEKNSHIMTQNQDNVIDTNDNVSFSEYNDTLVEFWTTLVGFLNAIQTETSEVKEVGVLPEDIELCGFLPLPSKKGKVIDSEHILQCRLNLCLEIGLKFSKEKHLPIQYTKAKIFTTNLRPKKEKLKSGKKSRSNKNKEEKSQNRTKSKNIPQSSEQVSKKEKMQSIKKTPIEILTSHHSQEQQIQQKLQTSHDSEITPEFQPSTNVNQKVRPSQISQDASSMFINNQFFGGKPLQESDTLQSTESQKKENVNPHSIESKNSEWKPSTAPQYSWVPQFQPNVNTWSQPVFGNPNYGQWGMPLGYPINGELNTWNTFQSMTPGSTGNWNSIFSPGINSSGNQPQGTLFSNPSGNQT